LFIDSLDNIIEKLFKIELKFTICGDKNINYIFDNDRKKQLDVMLISYNSTSTVNFPARIHNKPSTAIDNIFIDNLELKNYTISPINYWAT
jgi:hypothetical protein